MENCNSLQLRFEKTAKRYCEKIALSYEDTKLTYYELNKLSDVICNQVRTILNFKEEATIAVLTENHSFMRFVYMLGILKAGYTYVPLDAHAISKRSFRILKYSRAELLLTEKIFLTFAEEVIKEGILPKQCIYYNDIKDISDKESKPCNVKSNENRIAYVIFTSGSTGAPKGVEVQDKAIINFADSVIKRLGITSDDKTLALSNFGFDASVFDMYPFLFVGARIVLIKEEEKRNIQSLNKYMINNGITIQCITTALYNLLLLEQNKVLKKVCVIGEKMLSYKKKPYKIYNMYGPTEATCLVTLTEITHEYIDIPVGYPLDHVQIDIMDEHMKLLKPGIKGQIIIRGSCLAHGYRNNKEENNKHFISLEDGSRAYLTGDFGIKDKDGDLHCYGRMDNQIKYRGYRIELDEIRKVMIQHENVCDAVVIYIVEKEGSYIAAAVSGENGIDENKIRQYLKEHLPEYMIPRKMLFMENFPLNRNKKIDSAYIRERFREKYRDVYKENEPTDKVKKIKELWARILCISPEKINVENSFTELGGDSLQSLTMLVNLNEEFKVKVPFEQFIEKPTISTLISLINKL